MGKCCLQAGSFIFDQIIIKVAGNQDRIKAHKSLISGRIRLLTLELLALSDENITLLNLNISETNWPILIKFYV